MAMQISNDIHNNRFVVSYLLQNKYGLFAKQLHYDIVVLFNVRTFGFEIFRKVNSDSSPFNIIDTVCSPSKSETKGNLHETFRFVNI